LVHGPHERDAQPHESLGGDDRHRSPDDPDVDAVDLVPFDHDAADIGTFEPGEPQQQSRADQPATDQPATDLTADNVPTPAHHDAAASANHYTDHVGWRRWRGVLRF
jgi:hypothetical protein